MWKDPVALRLPKLLGKNREARQSEEGERLYWNADSLRRDQSVSQFVMQRHSRYPVDVIMGIIRSGMSD